MDDRPLPRQSRGREPVRLSGQTGRRLRPGRLAAGSGAPRGRRLVRTVRGSERRRVRLLVPARVCRCALTGLDRSPHGAGLHPGYKPLRWLLLQVDLLIAAVLVDLGAPDAVRGLMLVATEVDRGAKPEVEPAQALEAVDQLLGVEPRTGALESLDQHAGGHKALER